MNAVRVALSAATVTFAGLGYLGSLYAYFYAGNISDYAAKLDTPSIHALCLVLFIAALICAFIKDKETPR